MALRISNKAVFASAGEMRRWGSHFAKTLRGGDVVALIGPLGAGKTTLVQGIARGWGCAAEAVSPTFALANEYRARRGFLFHLDLYRLSQKELADFPLDDYMGQGVCLIEWADRVKDRWPQGTIRVDIAYAGRTKRRLTVQRP